MSSFNKLVSGIKVVVSVVALFAGFSLAFLVFFYGVRWVQQHRSSTLSDTEANSDVDVEQVEDGQVTEDVDQTPAPAYVNPPEYTVEDVFPLATRTHSASHPENHDAMAGQYGDEGNALGLTGLDVDMGPRTSTELAYMSQEDEGERMALAGSNELQVLDLEGLDTSAFA